MLRELTCYESSRCSGASDLGSCYCEVLGFKSGEVVNCEYSSITHGFNKSSEECKTVCCPPCLADQISMRYTQAHMLLSGFDGCFFSSYFYAQTSGYDTGYCEYQCYPASFSLFPTATPTATASASPVATVSPSASASFTPSSAFTASPCDAHYHYKIIQVAEFMVAI